MAERTYKETASLGWASPASKSTAPGSLFVIPLRYYSDRDDQIHRGLIFQFPEGSNDQKTFVLLEFNDSTQPVVAQLMAHILSSLPLAKNFAVVDQSTYVALSTASDSIELPGFPGGSGTVTVQTDLHYLNQAWDLYFEAGFTVNNHLVSVAQLHEATGRLRLNDICKERMSLFRALSLADRQYTSGRAEFLELLHTRQGWYFKYSYLDNRGESRTGVASVFDFATTFFTLLSRRGGVPLNADGANAPLESSRFFDSSLSAAFVADYVQRLVIDYGQSENWEHSPRASATDLIHYQNDYVSPLRRLTFHKEGANDFHIYFDTSKVEGNQAIFTGGADIDFFRSSGAETAPLGSLYPKLPTSIAPGQVIDETRGTVITSRLHSESDPIIADPLANLAVALTSYLARRQFYAFSTMSSALPAFGGIPAGSAESLQSIIDALTTLTNLVTQSEGRFDRLDDGQRASLIATAEALLPPDTWGSHTDRILALQNVIRATFPNTLGDVSLFGSEVEGGPNDE